MLSASVGHAAAVDHTLLDAVLKNNVDNGRVNYAGIENDPRFEEYLTQLKQEAAPGGGDATLAYWINAYNALAIKGILDGRSPSTFFGRIGYFVNAKYELGGERINLYDLERKVIIPLGELRIHFAINCASASCPMLDAQAYTADNLQHRLDSNTRRFINDETRNRFDRENHIAYLSKIFDWFKDDFSHQAGSLQRYIAPYVNDPELADDLRNEKYQIRYLKYDWSLNGTLQGSE